MYLYGNYQSSLAFFMYGRRKNNKKVRFMIDYLIGFLNSDVSF